jgi:hypothetical protein
MTLLSKFGGIPTYTWTSKPSAANFIGQARISDIGINGSIWFSDGVKWIHESPIVIAQSGIQMIIPSSGSIGNNGALTLGTALPATYSDGVYMYFPANAISAGSAAGLYYVVMSSTTAGTIYNNTYTGGQPKHQASPTPFVTTGPGAYTQSTATEITLASFPLKGGVLGANGKFDIELSVSNNNSAGTKTGSVKFSSTALVVQNLTTSIGARYMASISNADREDRQRAAASSSAAAFSGTVSVGSAFQDPAIDTSADVTVSITGSLAVATDYMMLRNYSAEALPA